MEYDSLTTRIWQPKL